MVSKKTTKRNKKTMSRRPSESSDVSSSSESNSSSSTSGTTTTTREPRALSSSASSSSLSSPDATTTTTTATWFHKPSFQQSLFGFVVFVLGMSTGIVYVGLVQDQYGHGKDAATERWYLPLGPLTTANSDVCDNPQSQLSLNDKSIVSLTAGSNSKSKGIRLNKDIHNAPKSVVPTLFGVDYNRLVVAVGQPEQTSTINAKKIEEQQQQRKAAANLNNGISPVMYRLASTGEVSLVPSEVAMMHEIGQQAHAVLPNLNHRAVQASWGGPHHAVPETSWLFPLEENTDTNAASDLSKIPGGHLLYAYLYIMKWNSNPKFPFRLCGDEGCPPERAMAHTLEWREKYKPWVVPPSVIEENQDGYVFHRGFSPVNHGGVESTMIGSSSSSGKHGTVFIRMNHKVKNDVSFFRGVLNSADRAIAEALVESKGETGKFNVIFDCSGFSLSNAPSRHALKQGVTMLQDHYANRLGMIFLVHLSRAGELFLGIVLRLITKEVRDKIKILPFHDKVKSMAILKMVLEEESIPHWMGGTDQYQFDTATYYPEEYRCTEEEGSAFLTSMPYHAK